MESEEKFCASKNLLGPILHSRMCQIPEDLKYGSQFYKISEKQFLTEVFHME